MDFSLGVNPPDFTFVFNEIAEMLQGHCIISRHSRRRNYKRKLTHCLYFFHKHIIQLYEYFDDPIDDEEIVVFYAVALVYMEKIQRRIRINSKHPEAYFLVALCLAIKWIGDESIPNRTFLYFFTRDRTNAQFKRGLALFNRCEMGMLVAMGYNISVSQEEFHGCLNSIHHGQSHMI